ncbi:transcriptional regulator [Pseudonocardia sp. CNS-139]|nr:transcriptional regulator [Pseudonocardia sp. CNS-139]
MVRVPLSPADRERGERLGALLREARGDRSLTDVAAAAGISAETLRKIETGRIPTPAFVTVAALATTLGLSLDALATQIWLRNAESSSQQQSTATSAMPRAHAV